MFDQEMCSSTTDRTIYGSRSHARTNSLSRTFCYEVTDACVLISGVRWFYRKFDYQWLIAVAQVPQDNEIHFDAPMSNYTLIKLLRDLKDVFIN